MQCSRHPDLHCRHLGTLWVACMDKSITRAERGALPTHEYVAAREMLLHIYEEQAEQASQLQAATRVVLCTPFGSQSAVPPLPFPTAETALFLFFKFPRSSSSSVSPSAMTATPKIALLLLHRGIVSWRAPAIRSCSTAVPYLSVLKKFTSLNFLKYSTAVYGWAKLECVPAGLSHAWSSRSVWPS